MLMDRKSSSFTPEIWGGLECSFNRVGDLFMDQLTYSGHYLRAEKDIALFADLGFKAMRYPLIWEKHQRLPRAPIDWSFTSRQLDALRAYDIKPIVGLLHHGNGPAFADICSDNFAPLFANYAGSVARQFPWITYYTPINEPLTTARFGGLYGVWHPHSRDDKTFAIMLFNQVKAIVLAMKAIRAVNPQARLLQSEDLGKTYSTPLLQYQANFENERRWLTYDMLCGHFKPGHALWDFFRWLKVPEALMNYFHEHPCPPDMIGADHYLTSERFLDHELKQYPAHSYGGNQKHCYADVEAVRVNHPEPSGLQVLLQECWHRYKIPIAITEVHLNGTSDDQIRWFKQVWDTSITLTAQGIGIQAVTAWALLGSYGWSTLLTIPHGHYEQGAFDVSSGNPEPTALAAFLKGLAADPTHRHEALAEKGWWQQPERCLYNVDPGDKESIVEDRIVIPIMR
jgi:dTDP-4-dehydrorhamnose reductase